MAVSPAEGHVMLGNDGTIRTTATEPPGSVPRPHFDQAVINEVTRSVMTGHQARVRSAVRTPSAAAPTAVPEAAEQRSA
ncbi:hypothetical protein [Streptomyces sp. NPDC051576]|uniref:hypothetical protein n=1 Tax=Streptomyces sp. NPDC051576 TaxID=3155803 RepID=UPI003414768D